MSKPKYHFNPKSLTFEVSKTPMKQIIKRILMFLASAFSFAVAVVVIAFYVLDSPKEKVLKKENNALKDELVMMQHQIDQIQGVVNDMQDRDDHIYRTIFESNPYPQEDRTINAQYQSYLAFNDKQAQEILKTTHLKLSQLLVSTAAQSRSFEEVSKMAENKEDMMLHIPAIKPLKNGKLISGFGYRFHPILKVLRPHTGVDIVAPRGTPIFATADGTVVEQQGMSGYGVNVVIDHGYSYKTLYAHMSKKIVRGGQKVKRGQVIGYVGSTGLSQAPHLHYEVIKNGIKVNPVHFFFNDITPEEYEEILEVSKKVNQSLS